MKLKTIICTTIAAAGLLGMAAGQKNMSVEDTVMEDCRRDMINPGDNSASGLACSYYVAGFVHGLEVDGVVTNRPLICPPDGVKVGQDVRIVQRYLREHPEQEHLGFAFIAGAALTQAYGCRVR